MDSKCSCFPMPMGNLSVSTATKSNVFLFTNTPTWSFRDFEASCRGKGVIESRLPKLRVLGHPTVIAKAHRRK